MLPGCYRVLNDLFIYLFLFTTWRDHSMRSIVLPWHPGSHVFLKMQGRHLYLQARGGHFHIMELRIRVNKNVEKGSDFCHRASSTLRGQFSTTSTLRVSILNLRTSPFRVLFSAHQMLLQISRFFRN